MSLDTIYLDMDGVICDWVKGLLEVHNRYDLLDRYKADKFPTDWLMEGALGTEDELWVPVDYAGEEFWADLDPYSWLEEIVNLLEETEVPWYIATHNRNNGGSAGGKVRWLHRIFGNDFKQYILIKHKHLLSKPGALLIDDHNGNCRSFAKEEYGGTSIIFPQPWNFASSKVSKRIDYLKDQLDKQLSQV